MFANIGGANKGQFADLSALSGGDSGASSRGVAFADYDRDGLVDMYVVNFNGSPILYRNTTPVAGRHWIELDPVGTVSNRDGCGARVIIKLGTKRFARQAFCGSVSLGSGNDPYIHFGLGSSTVIDEVKVFWPSGRVQVLTNVAADQAMQVVEPA